jgi:hypothetical protein
MTLESMRCEKYQVVCDPLECCGYETRCPNYKPKEGR